MGRIEKTVFISYRRTNAPWALAVFQHLTQHGYDVFFDYNGVASGDFERVILENIAARAHFLLLLTPSALERCDEANDWLRREIEAALSTQRNIIPLMLDGFDFDSPLSPLSSLARLPFSDAITPSSSRPNTSWKLWAVSATDFLTFLSTLCSIPSPPRSSLPQPIKSPLPPSPPL